MKKCIKCGCKFHHKTCPYYRKRFDTQKFKGHSYIFTRFIEILLLILLIFILFKKQPFLDDISFIQIRILTTYQLKPNLSIFEAKSGFFHFIHTSANNILKNRIVLFRILTYQISPPFSFPSIHPTPPHTIKIWHTSCLF